MVNLAATYSRAVLKSLCCAVPVAALLIAPAPAQNAMRAPLDIVPPAMRAAIGQPKARVETSDKLAPRVAARQSKRAVRAVAAAPGSQNGIVQVGQLGALQDAPIGLENGFGSNLWRGARLAFIADQMARLPKDLSLAALRKAELTLHRSTTAAPVGTVDGGSWYAARLNRFLTLGDTRSVLQLEALTGAVGSDPYAARAIVLAHLGSGDTVSACAVPSPKRGTRGYADTLTFFMQLMVFCQLRAGEFEKAGLTLQLNEKSLGDDRFFRDLAFLMAAQTQPVFGTAEAVEAAKAAEEEPPLIVPSVLTPMQLALLQLVGYGITHALDQLPPYFMQSLAEDYAQPAATQLGAALVAVRHGSVTPERFSQLSQLTDLTSFQNPPARASDDLIAASGADAQVEEAPAPPPDAVFLALALLQVDAQPASDQAAALAGALAQAHARGLWRSMAVLLDDRLRNLAFSATGTNGAAYPADAPLAANEARGDDASSRLADNALSAALFPALRLLDAQDRLAELPFTPSPMAQRLLHYGEAPQSLANLIASLPGFEPSQEGFETLETPIVADDENDGAPRGFADLPIEEGGETAPSDTRPHPIEDWQAFEAQYAAASPDVQRYLTRELAIYEGLGFAMPAAYAIAASDDAAGSPLEGDALRIQKLADNKWVGDLVLALVDLYGGETSATLANSELVALLRYLRAAELQDVAAALAEELWLDAAGDLSQTAPMAFVAFAAFGSFDAAPDLSLGGLPSDDLMPMGILSASAALPVQP